MRKLGDSQLTKVAIVIGGYLISPDVIAKNVEVQQ